MRPDVPCTLDAEGPMGNGSLRETEACAPQKIRCEGRRSWVKTKKTAHGVQLASQQARPTFENGTGLIGHGDTSDRLAGRGEQCCDIALAVEEPGLAVELF